MIVKQVLASVIIVGLPIVNPLEYKVNKLDYTTPYNSCQQQRENNTMKYNYITSEEYLESLISKYNEVIP